MTTSITRWATAYLGRQWPGLDDIPDGNDMFAEHPIYYPPHTDATETPMRDEIRCDITHANGKWYVDVYRNGKHERRVRFNTQEAAVAFADAQLWAAQGG